MAKPTKPTKYPKKLRMTLEKVEARREEREAKPSEKRRLLPETYWESYLFKAKADAIVGRLAEDGIKITYGIKAVDAAILDITLQPVELPAPWTR